MGRGFELGGSGELQELPGPDGLLALKERRPGYKVFTAEDLKAKGYPCSAGGDIYAIFEVAPDPVFGGQKWDGRKLQEVMTAFESRRKYREMKALKFLSALPRVLSLQELLKAMRQIQTS